MITNATDEAGTAPDATDSGELTRLDELRREFERDARCGQVFVVLTVGSTLIATQGLLANSTAVVIGAMVVAPWILPLQAMSFEILRGRLSFFFRAFRTLMVGAAIGLLVSWGVGMVVALPSFGSEVVARTAPNLLDLGIALVAGGVAMYAKLRKEAISALAGLAIAVALVPPICVVGLLLSAGEWPRAYGALLLFATNLLGILTGAMVVLGVLERPFRSRLFSSRLGYTSLGLTALLLLPLGSSFARLVERNRKEVQAQEVESAILTSMRNETITLGRDSELVNVRIDWSRNPPLIRARVRTNNPWLPTTAQVAAVQAFINERQAPRRFRLVVERSSIDVIGPEAPPNPPALNGYEPLFQRTSPPTRPSADEEGDEGPQIEADRLPVVPTPERQRS